MRSKFLKVILGALVFIIVIFGAAYMSWSHIINWMMPEDSRPAKVDFQIESVAPEEFERMAAQLAADYSGNFDHIERFREKGVLAYEGPKTCLQCHDEIEVKDHQTGAIKKVGLMDNLTGSAHYTFFTERHPNVYGFNGELADNFPMGKIDRPCPKPGSFAMTAWAEIVVTEHGDTLSEGCGQCHIGGQYQAPLGEIMPGYETLDEEKEAIDCLICHSAAYDMNKKQVVVDENGKRWDQDRSIKAAMSVAKPTAQTCLRCHQHNFGGDIYIDEADSSYFQSLLNTGHERPRVLHPGSKRGTPYSPSWDVHAAMGMACIDCHVTEGHLIAKGTNTTTMMSNDLPFTEVACQNCHSNEAHSDDVEYADFYNSHSDKIACQTCHIPSLHEDNATMRDFSNPVYEEDHAVWVYDDLEKNTSPQDGGIMYVWWNGDASFLGNAIGDNPNGENLYRFYDPENIWPEYKDFDFEGWYENVMRPIAQNGRPSKLYAMKRFNGKQHIDLQNIGPFGGMYVPYNLPAYYTTGNPDEAARKEMEKSMMKEMYGWMFKIYLMDKFMSFMDIDGWNTEAYADVAKNEKVEPRWMPNDAAMEISHAIRKDGALTCGNCHSSNGVLNWSKLGYSEEDAQALAQNPLE